MLAFCATGFNYKQNTNFREKQFTFFFKKTKYYSAIRKGIFHLLFIFLI